MRLHLFALTAALLTATPALALDGASQEAPPEGEKKPAGTAGAPAAPAAEGPAAATALPEETQVPARPAFDPYVAVSARGEVRVRAGPSANYRVLEHLPKGAWVVVTGTEGEFARVRIPGGVPVFVSADLLEAGADGKTATVARSDVLMRPTPGQEFFPLEGQKLQQGEVLAVLGREKGESGEWVKVLPPDRVEYFVAAALLEKVAPEGQRAEELARITLERRDGYTGGKEAEEARERARKIEQGLSQGVDGAAEALARAPAATLPEDAEARRASLQQAMTESGAPATRARASKLLRDYLVRERDMKVARAREEKAAVGAELERRLAEVEARYRRDLDSLLRAAPRPAAPRHRAVGTVRRNLRGDYELVKGGVVLHGLMSLRYDLGEFSGLRVGVNGEDVLVDAAKRFVMLRVDSLEILE